MPFRKIGKARGDDMRVDIILPKRVTPSPMEYEYRYIMSFPSMSKTGDAILDFSHGDRTSAWMVMICSP